MLAHPTAEKLGHAVISALKMLQEAKHRLFLSRKRLRAWTVSIRASVVYRLRSNSSVFNPFRQVIRVYSVEESLERIASGGLSVARFGDGELYYLAGHDIDFQSLDPALIEGLRDVASNTTPNMAVCIPDIFTSIDWMTRPAADHWKRHLMIHRRLWMDLFGAQGPYYNAYVSRLYVDWKDKADAANRFDQVKKLWDGRDVVIIEGEKTRLGVGNDLLTGAASVRRVLCPASNAWAKSSEIVAAVEAVAKDALLLLALGPTATVLAQQFTKKGFQAIDIGHVDIEYEWFLRGAMAKIPIEGKFVSEASETQARVDDCMDSEYQSQVVCVIS